MKKQICENCNDDFRAEFKSKLCPRCEEQRDMEQLSKVKPPETGWRKYSDMDTI